MNGASIQNLLDLVEGHGINIVLGVQARGERIGMAGQTCRTSWSFPFWYAATCAVSYTTMTKDDLIEEVSQALELPLKEGVLILDTIFGGIVRSLRQGDKVELRGFGSFRTRQRRGRIGRNPKTGARVDIAAKTIPYFRASRELKERIQQAAEPISIV